MRAGYTGGDWAAIFTMMGTPEPRMRLAGDWNGPPPPLSRRMRWWSATQWLIAVNVAAFVAQILGGDAVTDHATFSIDAALFGLQLWRWVSSAFVHADPTHLIVNMIALWAFGPTVEARLGKPRFVAFYLLSGLGGVLGYLLLWRTSFLDVTPSTELLGASGCIFGLVAAAAHLSPNRRIRWIFPPVEMRFITVCWIYVGWAVLNVAKHGPNAGGDAAHLGGAAVGFVLVRNLSWFSALRIGPKRHRFWRPGDPASNFFRPDA
jgi:membrane associated rhomboid family serine protease